MTSDYMIYGALKAVVLEHALRNQNEDIVNGIKFWFSFNLHVIDLFDDDLNF